MDGWLTETELFTDPLMPFCYIPSMCAALDLRWVSLEDMDEALGMYELLVYRQESHMILENVAAVGLQNPFAGGWAMDTSAFLHTSLPEGVTESAA